MKTSNHNQPGERKPADANEARPDAELNELREELVELQSQRETIDERLGEVRQRLQGLADPEEIVPHDDPAAKLEQELCEMRARYQRALADFQNYQRRSLENEREARRQGVTSVVESLLGVLDNFALALSMEPSKATPDQVRDGVRVIRDEMLRVLGSLGLSAIEPKPNEEFDPQRHEALIRAEAKGVEPGRVAAMLQSGYMLGERVLRPAKVSVTPQREETEPAPEDRANGDPDQSA